LGFWGQLGENVLVEFENFFLIGGIFLSWGQKKFWDRENHLFWELYGPLMENCLFYSEKKIKKS